MRIRRDFIFDPSLVLYLPLYELDGASFMSRDAYGHLCTVTGALWRPRDRSFDGTDDEINCGSASSLDVTSALTLMGWLNPNEVNEDGYMIAKTSTGGANSGYSMYWKGSADKIQLIGTVNGAGAIKESSAVFTESNTWVCPAITVSGNAITFFKNGEMAGTATDTIPSTTASVYIGNREGGTIAGTYFRGLIGEVWIYSRALTHLEIQHNYLATKWRYR